MDLKELYELVILWYPAGNQIPGNVCKLRFKKFRFILSAGNKKRNLCIGETTVYPVTKHNAFHSFSTFAEVDSHLKMQVFLVSMYTMSGGSFVVELCVVNVHRKIFSIFFCVAAQISSSSAVF